MNRMRRPVLAALSGAAWLLLPTLLHAADPAVASRIEAVFKPLAATDQPGAAVIVVKDGQVVYRKAYGMADLELGVPLEPESVFRLGSVTKQFTAVAVMMLVEQGKLGAAGPHRQVPGRIPDAGARHHGGTPADAHLGHPELHRHPGLDDEPRQGRHDRAASSMDGFKKEPMQFAPGEQYRYNNSGYVLLGAIVEKVAGKSYEAFVSANHLHAARHESTYVRQQRTDHPEAGRRVHGRPAGVRHAQYLSMSAAVLGRVAGLDRGRPRAVGCGALHGEAAQTVVAGEDVDAIQAG